MSQLQLAKILYILVLLSLQGLQQMLQSWGWRMCGYTACARVVILSGHFVSVVKLRGETGYVNTPSDYVIESGMPGKLVCIYAAG